MLPLVLLLFVSVLDSSHKGAKITIQKRHLVAMVSIQNFLKSGVF